MLAKLSFRNAKRQAHDYIIYFVTLTAIFSLIHGLNSLLFAEDDIFPLDDSTFILPMILISSLLFSISLWLTSYMTNFILKRRSKEISIYITLGMEPYQISKVFTLENFYISIFALILLFFGGYYIYSSGIFGASVTENISEHSITDEERLIEYEEYGITYDESSQSYLYQDSLIKNLRDGDFLYTNAAGSIKLIIQRDDNGHIQSIDVE